MFKDENRHYSLRKLSIGLASVLIGISFFSVKANTAYADSLKPGSAQTEVINQKANNTNQDTTNSSKPEAKVENAQKQATATDEIVNKKQDDQVSRQVNEGNSTTSPEQPSLEQPSSEQPSSEQPSSEQPSSEEPDYKIVKTRNDIDQNKLSVAKWQFTDADDNNKAIADSTILIVGNSGDTFTKDQITLPKGYEDRNDLLGKNAAALKLPAAGTFTAYTLPLSHHHTDLTKQAPEDEVKQTRTVTVHYKYLDGDKANQEAAPDAKLDIYYSRNKFKDDVTGKISYTPWFWDKSQGDPEHPGYHIVSGKWDNLPEQWDNVIANVPTIAGYTAVLDEPNRPDNVNHVNANTFVHPIWNNSLGSGMTDANKDSLAYLATNTLYEAKNEHTVYYKANDENINDAFALDSKNGLHEHANVNDNGGYDSDFWGKINVDDWDYTVNDDRIEINGLKDGASTGTNDAVIVPNLDDFKLASKDGGAKAVYISKDALSKTAKHKYYGLSKTNDNTFVTDSNLNSAFRNDSNLTHADLNSLNTNNVTNMSNMFSGTSSLTSLDVSNWDTSKVTDMSYMFNEAESLVSLDVSKWNTGNVTDMSSIFKFNDNGASSLTSLDVSNWDTSNVTNMNGMFNNASSLKSLDVSKWNTSKVTDMSYMFSNASKLTSLDVSKWDTGNVTDMHNMFEDTYSLTSLDVSKWNTGNVTDMSYMFEDPHSLTSLDVSNWDTSNVTNMNGMFNNASSLKSLDVSNWDTSNVTNMNGMFDDADNLTDLDVSHWDTGKVTDMSQMFSDVSRLTSLDVSNWDTGKVTDMSWMFNNASSLKSLDVSKWDTGNVTNMINMFRSASSLTSLDVSKWDTRNVTYMNLMFNNASSLTGLDVSKWNTGKVTYMNGMFADASSLTSLDVSKWDTSNVTYMIEMFSNDPNLALIVNSGKFADYLVNHDIFAMSTVDSDVKSVTTDNTKLLKLLTSDVGESKSATRTIVFTFPTGYSPDLNKYHLTKNGNTYQIKQSADYDKSYVQGTVLINATYDIAYHHIDTTKPYKLSWQPNYDKLVLAHKNADGSVSFDAIQLPKVPGYKTIVRLLPTRLSKTVANPVNPARALFAVSFMALPKPVPPVQNDVKPVKTVTLATPVAIEMVKPIKTEPKVATTLKVIDLSDDAVSTTPKEATWQVANNLEHDTYYVSNGQYAVKLPHISNAQLYVIANDSTKDSVLFTYKGQNTKYVFNIKFVNGHYLLTTYKIKSGKLVKLIDYNFIKSSKMIDVIVDWIKLK